MLKALFVGCAIRLNCGLSTFLEEKTSLRNFTSPTVQTGAAIASAVDTTSVSAMSAQESPTADVLSDHTASSSPSELHDWFDSMEAAAEAVAVATRVRLRTEEPAAPARNEPILSSGSPTQTALAPSVPAVSNTTSKTKTKHITLPKKMRGDWILESVFGAAKTHCGARMSFQQLPTCELSDLVKYSNLSSILQDDPGDLSSIVDKAYLLGEGGPSALTSCRAPRGAMDARSVRLLVDSQFFNAPRCCKAYEVRQLAKDNSSLVQMFMESFASRQEHNLKYWLVGSGQASCSEHSRCPLVVQIPGAGNLLVDNLGDPWLALQAGCKQCASELAAVLVVPRMELDLQEASGRPSGSSNRVLETVLEPLVSGLLKTRGDLDPERVYLVAQSRGCDTALRAGLLFPQIFKSVILSSYFYFNDITKKMVRNATLVKNSGQGKLKSIQFHVGDMDAVFKANNFFKDMKDVITPFKLGKLDIEMRIYPTGGHNIWFATWNALHEFIWTGTRQWPISPIKVSMTCKPQWLRKGIATKITSGAHNWHKKR